jgi:hypothetical protein
VYHLRLFIGILILILPLIIFVLCFLISIPTISVLGVFLGYWISIVGEYNSFHFQWCGQEIIHQKLVDSCISILLAVNRDGNLVSGCPYELDIL